VRGEPITILLVEDEPAHAEIIRRNFENFRIANRLEHVSDGEEALDYLYRRGRFGDPGRSPRPGVILLDLRLPKIDGIEVLEIVKSDRKLRRIPVVVLTTSAAEADKIKAYDNYANSYLVKPVDHAQFVALMQALGCYWLAWNDYPYERNTHG
jgi:CheY-like chemotaxis protein